MVIKHKALQWKWILIGSIQSVLQQGGGSGCLLGAGMVIKQTVLQYGQGVYGDSQLNALEEGTY